MKRITVYISILMMMIIWVTGCEKKVEHSQNVDIDSNLSPLDMKEKFRLISEDFINFDDPVRLTLDQNEYAIGKEGIEVKNLTLDITPKTKGKLLWKNKDTFYFIPDKNFVPNQEYEVMVYPSELKKDAPHLKPLKFNFTAIGREIADYNVVLKTSSDEMKYWLEGKLLINTNSELEKVAKAAEVEIAGKPVIINWKRDSDTEFKFESEVFDKNLLNKKELTLTICEDGHYFAKEFCRIIDLQALGTFSVNSIRSEFSGTLQSIIIDFNENLQKDQDFSSLITMVPALNTDFSLNDNRLIVRADFKYGDSYQVRIEKNIRSVTGKKLKKSKVEFVAFYDKNPRLTFNDSGVYYSGDDNNSVCFSTVNISKIDYNIEYIYENNLCRFFQENSLDGINSRYWEMRYIADEVAFGTFEIGDTRNEWIQSEINLSELIPTDDYGIYKITLSAEKEYSLYREIKGNARYHQYGGDPTNSWYWYRNCKESKYYIKSDLAVSIKTGKGKSWCYVTDIRTAKPVWGAKVELVTYKNQLLATGETVADGSCILTHEKEPFYVTATYEGQRSAVKISTDKWETSNFDVGGKRPSEDNLHAYFYNERGVYRPGDEINTMIVMRNGDKSFPDNHPIGISITDPRNKKVLEMVLKSSEDGVYHFPYRTSPDDPTGSWNMVVEVGENKFGHELRVETVAPERLKLTFEPEAEEITPEFSEFKIDLQADYLFGRPAADLKVDFFYSLNYTEKKFPQSKWNDFRFSSSSSTSSNIFNRLNQTLDENGRTTLIWNIPSRDKIPSAGIFHLEADVIDKGGRSSSESINLPYSPWQYYTGIRTASDFISTSSENEIEIVLLDNDGKAVSGEHIQLRVYENMSYWWWEYNNYNDYLKNFKTHSSTRMIIDEELVSGYEPIKYRIPPNSAKRILVEAVHYNIDGKQHSSTVYLRGRYWGDSSSRKLASLLELNSDKVEYHIGDTAHIRFPSSQQARNLVSVEKGDRILSWEWVNAGKKKDLIDYEIKITEDMVPGAYISVSVIQPHEEDLNDCPLRMYGIIPIKVIDPKTIEKLTLNVPDKITPLEKFECVLQGTPNQNTQYTIAVVDEGLLSLTGFQSPDPWKYFYGKERLELETADNFNLIANEISGNIDNRFSVGGGMEMFSKRQIEKTDVKRFKPVSMFSGIRKADKSGKVIVEFEMPDYMGAVRVMAVSINNGRYGSVAKNVPVRNELMVLPTLPRALAPQDTIIIPVEIFCFDENVKNVNVELDGDGPIRFIDGSSKDIDLNERGEAITWFNAMVLDDLNPISIAASVKSSDYYYKTVTDIPVRALQPRQQSAERKLIKTGETQTLNIDRDGYEDSETFTVQLLRTGYFDFNKHLSYLIRYPYGCLEQKTSSVFPQLFITDVVSSKIAGQILGDIDNNINRAIGMFADHQQTDGRLTYWSNTGSYNVWAHSYAVHFLVEARQRGYHVPPYLIDNAIRSLKLQNPLAERNESYLMTALYQQYVLAKAGEAQISRLNFYKENYQESMNNLEIWVLAGAYESAGHHDIALSLVRNTPAKVYFDKHYRYSYGSIERDQALLLGIAMEIRQEHGTEDLYFELVDKMNSDRWLSTQSRAFMLWGLSKYVKAHPEIIGDENVDGVIKTDGSNYEFAVTENDWRIEIDTSEEIEIELSDNSAAANFVLVYDRIPKEAREPVFNEDYAIKRALKNDNGVVISPEELLQGESYTLNLILTKSDTQELDNVALVQILPSGWEFINERVSGGQDQTSVADYVDIRDDRIIWFFSAKGNPREYRFKIPFRAVTAGTFVYPPAIFEAMYSPSQTVITETQVTKIAAQ